MEIFQRSVFANQCFIMTTRQHDLDMYRVGMISKGELDKREQERIREQIETVENCKKGIYPPIISLLGCCCIADLCFEEEPCKKSACGASLSGMFYGAVLTGVSAANSWPCGLGTGISAIVLGALTATGLCADKFCCSDFAAPESNPAGVPPGVTLGSPAIIYQPQ